MKRFAAFAVPALLGAGFVTAVGLRAAAPDAPRPVRLADQTVKTAVATVGPSKASSTQPSQGQVKGTVTFEQGDSDVKVTVDLTGFPPNTEHGFHIHQKGDLSAPDLSSAGGHFNPGHKHHGGPDSAEHHAGDMGNLTSDAQGNVKLEITLKDISLNGENGILGKSVIIHAKADDLKSDPAGNSGPRIAGGVIEAK